MAVPNMIKVNYTLTVYKNTGFNGFDIPADPSILELCDKVQYNDSYYLREDFDKPVINVNDNYHNLSDADYVKLHANQTINNQPVDLYYFCKPSPLANGTTALTLDLDGLLTLGGAKNLEYTSGIQTRGHIPKEEDVLFDNVASEAWMPRQPLQTPNIKKLDDILAHYQHEANDLNIILTTVDLKSISETANFIKVIQGQVEDGEDPVMYIPKIQSNKVSTVFELQAGGLNAFGLEIPNVYAYDAKDDNVIDGLNKLFSCGQLQLQNSYIIPKEYVRTAVKDNEGGYSAIAGNHGSGTIDDMPFEYDTGDYSVKNKKCYITYRMYTLCNVASGASIVKPISELKYENHDAPVILIYADPTSSGKPFARFITDLSPNVPFIDTVEGSQWCNSQIVLEGASGSLWNSLSAAFNQQTISRNQKLNELNNQNAQMNYEVARDMFSRTSQAQELMSVLGITGNLGSAITGGLLGTSMSPSTLHINADKWGGVIGSVANAATGAYELMNVIAPNNQDTLYKMEQNRNADIQRFELEKDRLQQSINENRIGELRNNNVVAPTEIFTPTPNLAMYGNNVFYLYETRKSLDDLKDEDMYYQMFGYNGLNKKLTKDCFKAREYYNFVQAYNINLKSNKSTSMRLKMKAISQLNGGVRLWNVLPDASYYELN